MPEQTRNYRVHLVTAVSTTVEVEATSIEEARDLALEEAPQPVNSSNRGIDQAGEWEEHAVYDDSGAEVWNAHTGASE